MKRLAAIAISVAALFGCSDDNDEIRARPNDVYQYTHWKHTYQKGTDKAELHFKNMTTGEKMIWKGDVRDAMVYLEQIDKGDCYYNPVSRDQAKKVPCG